MADNKKILLHICCGPCSIYPLDYLEKAGLSIHGFFYNPNIHPYTEYLARRQALDEYAQSIGLNMIYDDRYMLEEFLRGAVFRETERCRHCYVMRLEQAARFARKGKFDYFTTTLLVSPYQKHELIRETGEAAGKKFGVPFYYVDFREGYRRGAARSRDLKMYRQQYCGCIYSEKERYCKE